MSKKIRNLSEEEIDQLVIGHVDDDAAWGRPVRIRRSKSSKSPHSSNLPEGFLEQAERLLRNGYYAPAAVIAGSVLEDAMRRFCKHNDIALSNRESTDLLNIELAKAGAYSAVVQERIAGILDMQNKAAHGDWSEFNERNVEQMIAQIRTYERLFRLTEQFTTFTLKEEEIAELPIVNDPAILSGEAVFSGTRVPVAALLDNLTAGLSLDEFLDNFPTVTRDQALKVLEFSKDTLARLGRVA